MKVQPKAKAKAKATTTTKTKATPARSAIKKPAATKAAARVDESPAITAPVSAATRMANKLKPRTYSSAPKRINMALQGGGAHGAFGWGVMDKFLEDGRVEIEGLSGTSAGSMNAVVYAYGKIKGNDGARQALHDFWKAISDAGQK